jgi:hypothetical protein
MLEFALGALAALAALALLAALRIARWRRRRGRAGWRLRGLFRTLGTRPEQEAAIAEEVRAFASELHALRDDGRALREEIASLLGAPALDGAALDAALAARLERLGTLRARAAGALARLHAVLDERQRQVLAAMLRGGGHLRHAHRHC